MSKLIYADEVKKRFPIMENDFGMVVNETLHKELDKIPTVKAIPLEKINKAIEEMKALADPKNTILDFNEKMGLKTAMNILVRSIREGECNLSEKPIGSESEDV